eukprot:7966494-Prorocentrum_lima.AAC.1
MWRGPRRRGISSCREWLAVREPGTSASRPWWRAGCRCAGAWPHSRLWCRGPAAGRLGAFRRRLPRRP